MSDDVVPRYVDWRGDQMQSDTARTNLAEFHSDPRRSAALADEDHPSHRQALADFLMCLDKGDLVSRFLLERQMRKTGAARFREQSRRDLARYLESGRVAREWWRSCLLAQRAGRKTVRLDDLPLGHPQ